MHPVNGCNSFVFLTRKIQTHIISSVSIFGTYLEVNMKDPRVAFYLFGENGIAIHWYGIIIATGLIIGVILGVREAKRRGYRSEMILDFMLIAIPVSIVCARLYYVIFEWNRYANDLLKIFAIWEGGLAIYGAVIGGAIAAIIFYLWRRVSVGEVLDIAAPSLIIAQGIGRWGNFVNQEAHGGLILDKAWQWFPAGVQIDGLWYQATFFYEFVWNVIVFAILMLIRKKIKVRGGVFALYGILYGLGRFWIESLRTDSLMLNSLRISQIVSIMLIVCGILYLFLMRNKEWRVYDGYYSLSWTNEQIEEYKANSKSIKAEEDAKRADAKAKEIKEKYDDQLEKVKKAEVKAERAKKKLEKVRQKAQQAETEKQQIKAEETDSDVSEADNKKES